MMTVSRVVDIRLSLPVFGEADLGMLERDLASKIRRARSVDYEVRKHGNNSAPSQIIYVLDRRVDWSKVPELLEAAINQLQSRATYLRNPNSAQWVLFSEKYEFKIVHTYSPDDYADVLEEHEIISLARRTDMEGMLNDESVFFHHDRQAFFKLPSGEISDYFLRVGNLQRDSKNIEKIAFWALPSLSDVHHIICETWTISTTAAMIAQFIGVYESGRRVSWSYLSAYLPENIADIQHVSEVLEQAPLGGAKILFLVSASASGRIHKEFLKLTKREGIAEKTKIVTIFQLTDRPCEGVVIHELHDFLQRLGLRGSSDVAIIGSAPIVEIDKSSYIPKYRGATTKSFKVIEQTKQARDFFERYSGNGIFSVARKGRTSKRTPGRHYTYHIDIKKLLLHPGFVNRVSDIVASSNPVDALIFTPSPSNQQFLEIYLSAHKVAFGYAPQIVIKMERLTLIKENKVVLDALCDPDQHVLILESLLVEGANLKDLEPTIRELRDSGYPSQSLLTYFVGLFRPYSKQKRKWVQEFFPQCSSHDGFAEKAKLTSVETVILPKWSETDCPWKRELRAHEQALDNAELDERQTTYIHQRVLHLTDAMRPGGSGLTGSSVFFKRNPNDDFPFWSGSFWLNKAAVVANNSKLGIELSEDNVTAEDLICAVACAIHTWRFENPTSNLFTHDLNFDEIINQEVTSENAGFNEPMLRAAIWRALKPSEISVSGSNSDTESMLADVFLDLNESNSHRVLGGEAALAYAWRLRGLLGPERAGKVDWEYLLELADRVSDP